MKHIMTPAVLVAALLAVPAVAAVADLGPAGFQLEYQSDVHAPPARVYAALLQHVGDWWNPQHTYSGDAHNLSIDARPGGCFCERLADGGGIEHLRVVYLAKDAAVRFRGALGPLQSSGLAGSMTWKLAPAPEGTHLTLSYSVGGYMKGGFERMAPAADAMLGEQLQRLKRYAETSQPSADAPPR